MGGLGGLKQSFVCIALTSVVWFSGCNGAGEPTTNMVANPPAWGFDIYGSDPQAMTIADASMEAMGGRQNWDNTRFLSWNFFGVRQHYWDRHTGDIRIGFRDRDDNDWTVLMNLETREGRVQRNGEEVNEGLRDEMLQSGYEMWVNDSYWLIMPYKLKDSGVTLTYVGEGTLEADGRAADVLQLTFRDVGVTPQNKYHVWVARDTNLVEQWAFFRAADDANPIFTTPWTNWTQHGNIMLSGDRGERQISDIKAPETLPAELFSQFDL